jgi:hypothetical protein
MNLSIHNLPADRRQEHLMTGVSIFEFSGRVQRCATFHLEGTNKNSSPKFSSLRSLSILRDETFIALSSSVSILFFPSEVCRE